MLAKMVLVGCRWAPEIQLAAAYACFEAVSQVQILLAKGAGTARNPNGPDDGVLLRVGGGRGVLPG